MRQGGLPGYEEFQQRRFFGALDGVRALSVGVVVIHHLSEKSVWSWLNGWAGVQVFFVLSGFLITTLCVREVRGAGSLSRRDFYIRRAYRILPLYVLTIVVLVALMSTGVLAGWEELKERIVYYITLCGDFVRADQPFQWSWSLGVEEKFYLLWPLLVVGLWQLRARVPVALAAFGLIAVLGVGVDYIALYTSIAAGCCLAFILADRHWYERARVFASRKVLVAITVVGTLSVQIAMRKIGPPTALLIPFALLVTATMGCVLIRSSGWLSRGLSLSGMRWVGRRAYGIYLVHPIVIQLMGKVITPSTTEPLTIAIRLVLAIGLSVAIADVLHRTVERPMIRRGHELTKRVRLRREASREVVAPVAT